MWGPLRIMWPPWGLCGAPWDSCGAPWDHVGPLEDHVGRPRGPRGTPWGLCGCTSALMNLRNTEYPQGHIGSPGGRRDHSRASLPKILLSGVILVEPLVCAVRHPLRYAHPHHYIAPWFHICNFICNIIYNFICDFDRGVWNIHWYGWDLWFPWFAIRLDTHIPLFRGTRFHM